MSDKDDQYDDDDDGDDDKDAKFARIKVKDLQALRAKEKRAEEGDKAVRELAFVKAGIDTDTKLGKLFFNAYDGKLDKEAILKEAADIPGLIPTKADEGKKPEGDDQKPPEGNEPSDDGKTTIEEELALTKERRELAGGGKPPTGKSAENPKDAALKTGQEALKKGATEEAALASFIHSMGQAAHGGDERVMVQSN